jgi:hypothetical protein
MNMEKQPPSSHICCGEGRDWWLNPAFNGEQSAGGKRQFDPVKEIQPSS